jgi:protein gp37
MKPEWVLNLERQVEQQHIAFFFKQWGTWGSDGIKRSKHTNGKLLNGKIIQQMPAAKTHPDRNRCIPALKVPNIG